MGQAAQEAIWRQSMLDILMLVIGLGGFALMIAYVALCERL